MSDTHPDFMRDAKRLLRNGVVSVSQLAEALQKQYRAGFENGQRDGERYERDQQAYNRF